jgi:hypothetical protein
MIKQYDRSTQDVGNILALEHVNVTVPDQEVAGLFYVTGLGFTRDPYMDFGTLNMWVNLGSQQFHLPKGEVQVFRGRIGLVVPDLVQLQERLKRLERVFGERVQGTQFRWDVVNDGARVDVTCPWGNRPSAASPSACPTWRSTWRTAAPTVSRASTATSSAHPPRWATTTTVRSPSSASAARSR